VPDVNTVILGAGAAGLFAARSALKGGTVVVIDHAAAPGEKIRISGGGRCNFTNVHAGPANFISENRHFAKSALARFTPADFVALVEHHGIAWHEKTLGQLFCDGKATQITDMLLREAAGIDLRLKTSVSEVHHDGRFHLSLSDGSSLATDNLVVATGGKSIPKMGASDFGLRLARQFGLAVTETRPGLVPLTFGPQDLAWMAPLAGVALPVVARANGVSFTEAALFTHRGLSGPAILQVSNYWREGDQQTIDLLPDALPRLRALRQSEPRKSVPNALSLLIPSRLAEVIGTRAGLSGNMADQSDKVLGALAEALTLRLKPTGTEGYRTAEVTVGGVSTDELDARTMEARKVSGLYFIGEVVDVTGWLGGYNFQWAWASGHAAGVAIAAGRLTGA
jgi:predicted Rossmann fold flavoprotein